MRSPLFHSLIAVLLLSVASAVAADWTVFVETHCLDCHDSDSAKGDIILDSLNPDLTDAATAELWNRVLDQVAFREMPPKDKPQPPGAERGQMVAKLENALNKSGHPPDLRQKLLEPE